MNDDSMSLGFGPDPQRVDHDNQEHGSAQGTVTLSQEQFEAMLARISGSQERDYASAMGEVVQPEQPQQPHDLVDLTNLPDPRADPEGFKSGLTQVLNTAGNQLLAVSQQRAVEQQSQTSVLDTAWAMLRENYADVAEHNDIIELAATREMQALRARGIDPMLIIQNNTEGFVDAVAARAQTSINRIRGMTADEAGEDNAERSEVLMGGSPRPGKPQREIPKTTSLVDELKLIQREMGIY